MSNHITINPPVLYFGTPVVLIVTRNPDGRANITPMSSAWALGSSVVLGLSSAGQGAINLRREGECTLNFPSADLWRKVEAIAPTTGADPVPPYKAQTGFRHEADKFALGGFSAQDSVTVAPPRIRDCPLQCEARLLACHASAQPTTADAPSTPLLIEVAVTRVHAAAAMVRPGTDHIDPAQWNPLYYVFRHYFGDAVELGRSFRA